jgi:DNA-binding response OmpR family regulator
VAGDDGNTEEFTVEIKSRTESVSVLVVDDEQDIAELYSMWLKREYHTATAYDGEQALEHVDESTDIVFLDRQMPGLSGDEVLDQVDNLDIDCRVVMVTAVDPDFDIVDMPFDDYLTKPVTREDLLGAVDEMLSRESYDDQMQEYFAAVSKKATLESEKNPAELDESDEYAEINQRVDELSEQADQSAAEVDDVEALFHDLPGEE